MKVQFAAGYVSPSLLKVEEAPFQTPYENSLTSPHVIALRTKISEFFYSFWLKIRFIFTWFLPKEEPVPVQPRKEIKEAIHSVETQRRLRLSPFTTQVWNWSIHTLSEGLFPLFIAAMQVPWRPHPSTPWFEVVPLTRLHESFPLYQRLKERISFLYSKQGAIDVLSHSLFTLFVCKKVLDLTVSTSEKITNFLFPKISSKWKKGFIALIAPPLIWWGADHLRFPQGIMFTMNVAAMSKHPLSLFTSLFLMGANYFEVPRNWLFGTAVIANVATIALQAQPILHNIPRQRMVKTA